MKNSKKAASHDHNPHPVYHLSFDEFAGSDSLPAQWDLTDLMAAPGPSRNDHAAHDADQTAPGAVLTEQPASEPGEAGGLGSHWSRNFFPEPRTFPVEWDLSR
jgi:hypothetical protein